MSDEILTALEVAALLKVADKTVYTMAQKGEIPAFKPRGQWRFQRVDIDAWIQAQTTAPRRQRDGDASPANPPLAGRAHSLLSCAVRAPRFGDV